MDHDALAGPAAILRLAHHEHLQAPRHDVEPFCDLLADAVKPAAAARAGLVFDVDQGLDARKMERQRASVRPATRGGGGPALRIGSFRLRRLVRVFLLNLFEPKLELVERQALGAPAEAMALHLLQKLRQPVGARPLGQDHRLEGRRIVRKRVFVQGRHDRTTTQSRRFEAPDLRR